VKTQNIFKVIWAKALIRGGLAIPVVNDGVIFLFSHSLPPLTKGGWGVHLKLFEFTHDSERHSVKC